MSVPETVVELLETVDVAVQHRHQSIDRPTLGDGPLEFREEGLTVRQSGQRVVRGTVSEAGQVAGAFDRDAGERRGQLAPVPRAGECRVEGEA